MMVLVCSGGSGEVKRCVEGGEERWREWRRGGRGEDEREGG